MRGCLLPSPRSRGYTLHEMLISLAIGGSLTTGGVTLWSVIQDNAMTAAANEIVTHLALARSEAIKRHTPVKLCPSRDHASCSNADGDYTFWQHGWLVYADENRNGRPEPAEIVHASAGPARDIVIRTSGARSAVTYQPIGMSGGSTITFALCDARGPKHARYVTVSNGGRARASRTTDSRVKCT